MKYNIHIIGIPEGEESEQELENLFEEIMTENFPNLVKKKVPQVQEAQRIPNKLDPKRPTLRHIIIKMTKLKDKERTLKVAREKQVITYKGAPVRLASDYSTETFQASREWHEIFKVMKSKDLQPKLLYPVKLLFKIKGDIRSVPDKKKDAEKGDPHALLVGIQGGTATVKSSVGIPQKVKNGTAL